MTSRTHISQIIKNDSQTLSIPDGKKDYTFPVEYGVASKSTYG